MSSRVQMRLQFTQICPFTVPGCIKSLFNPVKTNEEQSYSIRRVLFINVHLDELESSIDLLAPVTRVVLSLCAAGSCVCNPVSHTHLQTGDSPLTPPAAGLQRPAVCHSLHVQADFRFVCLDPILFCHVVSTTLLGEC